MKHRIPGCGDRIGWYLRATSMLLDNGILIDAGAGVGGLGFKQLAGINQVFVSHLNPERASHMRFLADAVGWMCNKPITVHSTLTTQIISNHEQEMLRHNRICVF